MAEEEHPLERWKKTLVALAAVLVVVPSVISATHQVIVAWRGLPIGTKEEINRAKFEEHWKESPLHTKQIIIAGSTGKVPITIDVYENGDIFVDYGRLTQWFPYSHQIAAVNNPFISSAHAWNIFSDIRGEIKRATDVTNKAVKPNVVERTRSFSDGSSQTYTINANTGVVLKVEQSESNNPPPITHAPTDDPSTDLAIDHQPIEVIELPSNPDGSVEIYSIPNTADREIQ